LTEALRRKKKRKRALRGNKREREREREREKRGREKGREEARKNDTLINGPGTFSGRIAEVRIKRIVENEKKKKEKK